LQVNLTRLKKTMKELEMVQQIETVRGLGYRLTAEEKIDDE
jgi:DNA-binding response OmpR family regulator